MIYLSKGIGCVETEIRYKDERNFLKASKKGQCDIKQIHLFVWTICLNSPNSFEEKKVKKNKYFLLKAFDITRHEIYDEHNR